jgi:hypothetical protein
MQSRQATPAVLGPSAGRLQLIHNIPRIAYLWFIIVGGLIITPNGIWCIRCGPGAPGFIGDTAAILVGVISVVLAVAGLGLGQKLKSGASGAP